MFTHRVFHTDYSYPFKQTALTHVYLWNLVHWRTHRAGAESNTQRRNCFPSRTFSYRAAGWSLKVSQILTASPSAKVDFFFDIKRYRIKVTELQRIGCSLLVGDCREAVPTLIIYKPHWYAPCSMTPKTAWNSGVGQNAQVPDRQNGVFAITFIIAQTKPKMWMVHLLDLVHRF